MIKYISIITFIIYLLVILIFLMNIRKNSKIINYCGVILFLLLVLIFALYQENVVDVILTNIIRYWYFPTFNSYIITLFISFLILIISLLYERMDKSIRMVNYIFSLLLIASYVVFALLEIDVNSYTALYSGISLICLRFVSRMFISWILIVMNIKYYKYFLKRW